MHASHDAAVRLFLRQGHTQTRISHIARKAGVSVGTVCHDFAGEQGLLHFILQCAVGPDFTDREFQRALSRMIVLRSGQPLDPRPGGDGRRLCGKHLPGRVGIFLSESAVRYLCPAGPVRRGLSFHRKNPLVFPSRTAYYRESFFAMTEFIRKFQACGQLRTTEDPELTTALILEPLSRWAMDVRWRPLRPGTSRRSGPRRYVWTTCRTPTPGVDRSPVPPCFCETERRTSPLWCRPPEGLPQALPETQQRPYLPENGAGYR